MKREMSTASERLSDRQFRGISELIERQVGILLPAAKRTMVEGRLRKRVRALGARQPSISTAPICSNRAD